VGPAANFGVPRTYALAPGTHELRLVDPRFEEYTAELNIRAKKVTDLWENLKPLPTPKAPFGTLRVISPNKFDAVYLNGRFYGHTGEFNNPLQGLLIRSGKYELRVVPEKGGTLLAWMDVPVAKGETTTVYTK
jgi:hypothetical protein